MPLHACQGNRRNRKYYRVIIFYLPLLVTRSLLYRVSEQKITDENIIQRTIVTGIGRAMSSQMRLRKLIWSLCALVCAPVILHFPQLTLNFVWNAHFYVIQRIRSTSRDTISDDRFVSLFLHVYLFESIVNGFVYKFSFSRFCSLRRYYYVVRSRQNKTKNVVKISTDDACTRQCGTHAHSSFFAK